MTMKKVPRQRMFAVSIDTRGSQLLPEEALDNAIKRTNDDGWEVIGCVPLVSVKRVVCGGELCSFVSKMGLLCRRATARKRRS